MKVYEGQNIRNVAVVGHSHSGKSQLVSALLYAGGATQRLGRVDDGSAPTNYDDEEVARQMSITSTPAYVEWEKTKINLIDTPGFNMFV
ncbi:MAG TPA: GTP-binding protein, partial [Terriglobales bacterium]